MIQMIGKKSFVGKNDKRYFVIYYGQPSDQVEGLETFSDFVAESVYSKVRINGKYNVVYAKTYSGKAVIADLEPIRATREV